MAREVRDRRDDRADGQGSEHADRRLQPDEAVRGSRRGGGPGSHARPAPARHARDGRVYARLVERPRRSRCSVARPASSTSRIQSRSCCSTAIAPRSRTCAAGGARRSTASSASARVGSRAARPRSTRGSRLSLATTLLNRHAPGDVDRALQRSRKPSGTSSRPRPSGAWSSCRTRSPKRSARPTAATFIKLGYTRDAGAPDGGTLVATVSGLELPTLADDDKQPRLAPRGPRGSRDDEQAELAYRGRQPTACSRSRTSRREAYSVEAFVNSARSVTSRWSAATSRSRAHATTKIDLPYPSDRDDVDDAAGRRRRAPVWGIAIALPGKPPATVGALHAALAKAPWWTVATVHTARADGGSVLEAVSASSATAGCARSSTASRTAPTRCCFSDRRPRHCAAAELRSAHGWPRRPGLARHGDDRARSRARAHHRGRDDPHRRSAHRDRDRSRARDPPARRDPRGDGRLEQEAPRRARASSIA